MLKICFIGLGSIGKRHLGNLNKIMEHKKDFVVDAVRKNGAKLPEELEQLLDNIYSDIEDIPCDYDVIYVTNPTSLHYETIKAAVSHTKHMFIEKPVFQFPIEDIGELNLKKDGQYYVAAPLRYGPVISKLKELIKNEKIYSVRAICSSYLPEWRPNIDYRENYSAIKDLGGGVALDLIHEIDYITYLFGMPMETAYFGGTYSELEISSDDLGTYMLKYEDKLVEVHLDYFGRKTVRNIELYCRDYTIVGDMIANNIKYIYADHEEIVELPEDMDFIYEMKNFFDIINGKAENLNNIEHANEVLKISLNK